MKNVIKIVILFACAELVAGSCTRKQYTPDVVEQKTSICFSALSQNTPVKALGENNLAYYHIDFGVWGIAWQSGNDVPYVIWDADAMTQVTAEVVDASATAVADRYSGSFIPAADAYWLAGYTYDFLAVAPFESVDPSSQSVTIDDDAKTLSFTYDMGEKYADGIYDFDLMGAAAHTEVTSSKPTTQTLSFCHLMAKICINVTFTDVTDNTKVDAIRLSNILSKASYNIGCVSDSSLDVVYTTSEEVYESYLVLEEKNREDEESWAWNVHIVPQVASTFVMYLDFTLGETSTTNFKIDLTAVGNTPYKPNEQYNWNINISPKVIDFEVKVVDWQSGDSFDYSIQ